MTRRTWPPYVTPRLACGSVVRSVRAVHRIAVCAPQHRTYSGRTVCEREWSVQKILALVLIALGVIGLGLGRLGETVWAPPAERTASASINEAGSAVVLDPGVLYMSAREGTAAITAGSDVSIIAAPAEDVTAYLGESQYTRISGAADWETLSAEPVNPDGDPLPAGAASADLWSAPQSQPSPATINIAEFSAQENGPETRQPYRAVLLVPADPAQGITEVSITWPVEQRNAWVPYAYAVGAMLAIIGLIWFILVLGSGRGRADQQGRSDGDASTTKPHGRRARREEPATDRIPPVADERNE